MERHLATILAADMAGYSRLMEADEDAVILRQKAHRRELIDPEIERNRGRIVKTMGVGVLARAAGIVLLLFASISGVAAEPGKISLAYCTDCVPFHFQDEDVQPAGMIIDLWRLWSERTGIEIDFRTAPWDETLRMVAEGRADAHAGLFFSDARARFLEYGAPLTRTDTHFFVRKGLPRIETVEELAGYRVGVITGDFVEGFLKKRLPEQDVIGFETYDAIMTALREGRLQIFAADTPTGIYHLQNSGLGFAYEFPADQPLYRNDWLVAARKGNTELIRVIDAGMALISQAEKREIERRWAAVGPKGFELTAKDIATLVAFLAIVAAVGVLIWNRTLRRRIELRTEELEAELDQRRRVDEALRESEDVLTTIIDNMAAIVFLKSVDGRFIRVNRRYAEEYGIDRETIVGKTLYDIHPQELADKLTEFDRETIDTGGIFERENTITKNGEDVVLLASMFPVLDETGQMIAFGGIEIDITERKQAEEALRESEQLLQTILDHMPAPVYLRDVDGRFMLINRGYEEIHQVTRDDVRGKRLHEVFSQELADEYGTLDPEIVKQRRVLEGEETHQLADGEHTLAVVKFPIFDPAGEVVAVGGVDVDITERKRVEEALRETTAFLQLNQIITRAANEAVSIDDAMQTAVDQVCAHTGWPVGHAYLLDEAAGDLVTSGIWHLDDAEAFETFRSVTEATRFVPGVGLPGRVLASAEPVWIFDITKEPNFPRAKLATEIGVRAGVAFPVLVGPKVAAVLEFFSTEVVEAYEPLLEVMAQIGTQLGRVIERIRAEHVLLEAKDEVESANLALERAYDVIKVQNERMAAELNVAHDIQMSMVPLIFPAFPDHDEFTVFAVLEPAREVGGDFYDFFFIDEDRICVCIGDVSGKGVPAALFMAVAKTLIKSRARDDLSTASILTHVNDELSADNKENMFVTLFIGIANIRSGEVIYTNAGHNPPYVRRADGSLKRLDERHGPVIGAMEGMVYGEDSVKLAPADILFLYTDGVTEAMDGDDTLFSDERLEGVLEAVDGVTAENAVTKTVAAVKEFEGETEQTDDVTVLAFQYHGSSGTTGKAELQIVIENELSEIAKIIGAFEEFAGEHGIPMPITMKFNIVFDELLNNVISYAYRDEEEHEISIRIKLVADRLTVTIADDGVPFNPLSAKTPDTKSSLEDRDISGLGIHLVRELVDDVSYHRRIDKNVLTLAKQFNSEDL
ncbi:MAG: SpoIIE family protein phosphatase [Alphaproteobacteria bacterium]|nr:SpoIIE family protein phosphatase [Alphaproteobacteria bacterium]